MRTALLLAIALALPATALGLAAPRAPGPVVDAADAPARALALAAEARGVPGAAQVDLERELGPVAHDLPAAVAAFYADVVGAPLTPTQLQDTLAQLRTLSPGYQRGVATMLAALVAARELRDAAFAGVKGPDIAFADRVGTRAVLDPGHVGAAEAQRALGILARIDGARMLHAAALLQAAAAEVVPELQASAAPSARIDTAFNALTIGSPGSDTYDVDKTLLIEPGGDDLYLNNEGGVTSREAFDATGGCAFGGGTTGDASPNLGCTPLPSQVCTWDVLNNAVDPGGALLPDVSLPNNDPPGSGNGHDGTCGSDARRAQLVADAADANNDANTRAVAALLDLGGSDTYGVPWSHVDPLFGLVDFCYPGEQDKVNTNRDLFQGGTLSGIGLLWDDGGTNTFRGRLNAQGSGHVGGVGMLLSTGQGSDTFWADRLSQGNGIAAGVGLLVDTKPGGNTYVMDPPIVYRNEFRPNGRDCAQEAHAGQGEGGFLGVGVLVNVAQGEGHGRSVYRMVTHETDAAYPYAGSGALVGGTDGQGSGESFPVIDTPGGVVVGTGVLVDVGDGDASVCPAGADGVPAAGMLSGSSYLTRSMGDVDRACGKFNLPVELDPQGDLEEFFQHVFAGAVSLRVVA